MPRKPRAAAQAAQQSIQNAPPPLLDASDEEMGEVEPFNQSSPSAEYPGNDESDKDPDAPEPEPEPAQEPEQEPESGQELEPPTPAPEQEQQQHESAQDGEAAGTPAAESTFGTPSQIDTPLGRPAIPRKRRIGRPPKNPRPDYDLPDDGTGTPRIQVSTPVKRRRGRPAASGGRWGRNRGASHVSQVAVDKEGTMADVVNDEVVAPEDPDGETKIDKNGHLQGDREYRVRTFSLLGRGDRLYMLSTEPARCIGFRDSYLFFQKHKYLYKIVIDDDAKRDLIERDVLPHSYKGRAIGVVTARSVYREFGAKIVVGGRKVVDDYYEKAARERGDVEGEIAVPEDKLPPPGEPYNRNQFVAWHGASSVYHTNPPAMPLPTGKPVDSKKRKVTVTGVNWMLEHAREASNFNALLSHTRRGNIDGTYDVHTNVMQYPKIMQPSHARWERLPPPDPRHAAKLTKEMSTLSLTNGTGDSNEAEQPTTTAEQPNSTENQQAPALSSQNQDQPPNHQPQDPEHESIFSTIPAPFAHRFAIHDVHFESAPYANMGIPGPDGDVHDLGPNGIISAAHPSHPEFARPEILDELPPDCKEALLEAATREWEWKSKWRSEASDGARASPLKSYAWFP